MTAPAPGPAHTPHIARLDVLRALAFLAVFTSHMTGPFVVFKPLWQGWWRDYSHCPPVLYPIMAISEGWLGVPLFFVLSGFCIHYSTMKRAPKEAFRTGDFYWRRFLRIYPAYFVCVLICTALAPWLSPKYFNGWQVITHLLMIHNFIKMTFGGLNGPLWSLGVESQFYLLYPFLLLFMRRRLSWGQCLGVALVFNSVLQIYFCLTSQPYELTHTRPTFSFPLVTWCDWILGAALAESYVEGRRLFTRPALWLIGSALMVVLALNFRLLFVQGYLFGSVFFAVMMQQYLAWRTPLAWVERALAPIGLISYSLYLWHVPVLSLVEMWGHSLGLDATPLLFAAWNAALASAVVFPLAWLSYRTLETAVPKWLATVAKKKRASATANAAAS